MSRSTSGRLSPVRPHRRKISSCHTSIFARIWLEGVGGEFCTDDAQGLQEHSISDSSQCNTGLSSQALPSMRHPAEGITRTRGGTFGSLADWGSPLGRTSQDLLIQCSSIPTKAETAASTSRSERGRTADHSGVGLSKAEVRIWRRQTLPALHIASGASYPLLR